MRARLLFTCLLIAALQGTSIARRPTATENDSVEAEVRNVFDAWSRALTSGDKKTYINTFWDSPRLVIRVADGEWRGLDAYRKRIEAAQLPPGNPVDYRNIQVVALGDSGAVVTYERPAPGPQPAAGQPSTLFRGTAVFIKTPQGWKIAAWQAAAVTIKPQGS